MRQLREADIQRAITDLLDLKHIWWMRCNSGAMAGSHKGKKWFVRFGKKGMADLLAIATIYRETYCKCGEQSRILFTTPIWMEIKKPGKWATDAQLSFANQVRAQGHFYLVADSVDVVEAWLRERGL